MTQKTTFGERYVPEGKMQREKTQCHLDLKWNLESEPGRRCGDCEVDQNCAHGESNDLVIPILMITGK